MDYKKSLNASYQGLKLFNHILIYLVFFEKRADGPTKNYNYILIHKINFMDLIYSKGDWQDRESQPSGNGLAHRFNKKEQKCSFQTFFLKKKSVHLSPLLFCITPCVTSHSFYVPIFSLDWISNEIPRPCVSFLF